MGIQSFGDLKTQRGLKNWGFKVLGIKKLGIQSFGDLIKLKMIFGYLIQFGAWLGALPLKLLPETIAGFDLSFLEDLATFIIPIANQFTWIIPIHTFISITILAITLELIILTFKATIFIIKLVKP